MPHKAPLFDFAAAESAYSGLPPANRLELNPTGPYAIYSIAMARRKAGLRVSAESYVECDLFALAMGAPPIPYLTKIGGIPFRPYKEAWPIRDNQQLQFVAQFYFGDSDDLQISPLNDVLLVFSADNQIDGDSLHYEWWSLLDIGEFKPNPSWPESPFFECFGYRYRTMDYVVPENFPNEYCCRWDKQNVLGGFKIGGISPCRTEDAGTFLCSLGSVYPDVRHAYPWVNARRWTEADKKNAKPNFTVYDDATLQFFIENGRVNGIPCIG